MFIICPCLKNLYHASLQTFLKYDTALLLEVNLRLEMPLLGYYIQQAQKANTL